MNRTGRRKERLGAGVSREDKMTVRSMDAEALEAAKAFERGHSKLAATLRGRHNGTVIRTTNPAKWKGRI